jgi:hypothetical protein
MLRSVIRTLRSDDFDSIHRALTAADGAFDRASVRLLQSAAALAESLCASSMSTRAMQALPGFWPRSVRKNSRARSRWSAPL